jgi:SAM-dependent methyltransferase
MAAKHCPPEGSQDSEVRRLDTRVLRQQPPGAEALRGKMTNMSEKLPVCDQGFWRRRVDAARGSFPADWYKAVWDTDPETWQQMQDTHRGVLSQLIHPSHPLKVLDAGCGMGYLLEVLPHNTHIDYTGVDISPDMLRLARAMHPGKRFLSGDLRRLPFPDQHFDLAIGRSVKGMVEVNLGIMVWRKMETEILRVSQRLLLMGYEADPSCYRMTEAARPNNEATPHVLNLDGARLSYRSGQSGTVELYDLWVPEDRRRRGLGSTLIAEACKGMLGCAYGFTRADNTEAQAFYMALGFSLQLVPSFYQGMDAVLLTRPCLPALPSLPERKQL